FPSPIWKVLTGALQLIRVAAPLVVSIVSMDERACAIAGRLPKASIMPIHTPSVTCPVVAIILLKIINTGMDNVRICQCADVQMNWSELNYLHIRTSAYLQIIFGLVRTLFPIH